MKVLYEGYYVEALLRRKPDSDRWLVRVRVSWQAPMRESHSLEGPPDGFQTQEEAESYGIELGRKWVDDAKSRRDKLLPE